MLLTFLGGGSRSGPYVSTARKHGINAFEAIHDAVTGNPLDTNTFTNHVNSYQGGSDQVIICGTRGSAGQRMPGRTH